MSGFTFRPAHEISDRHGCFVALTGPTNCGKTYSAMRLASGLAGPNGKIAVLDTESGRTLHLKNDFKFDAMVMAPPFRPKLFAEAAKYAEESGYDAMLIDSASQEWVGVGGVLDWQAEELRRLVERQRENARRNGWKFDEGKAADKLKTLSWADPKVEHKAMVYDLLQRRMPIIFSIRGEETFDPEKKKTHFKWVCEKSLPFEATVSFRLAQDAKGIIDLSDKSSYKMEGAHVDIFKHGEQLSEHHGEMLAKWTRGEMTSVSEPKQTQQSVEERGQDACRKGTDAYKRFWMSISQEERDFLTEKKYHETFKEIAADVDKKGS